uniref:Uncharacterized protein n=1 Tax=Caenorhabditis japonica TaxID=281687 RepID=A0A8R1HVI8_CAEJA
MSKNVKNCVEWKRGSTMSRIDTWELKERTEDKLTFHFRRRSEIEEKTEEKPEEKPRMMMSKNQSSVSSESSSSEAEDSSEKKKKPVACDHLGVPLSHPLAVIPFPGRTSAAQREKARKMLNELAIRLHDEEVAKMKNKELQSKNSSALSERTMACDKCGSCQQCVQVCAKMHSAGRKYRKNRQKSEKRRSFVSISSQSDSGDSSEQTSESMKKNRKNKKKKKMPKKMIIAF